MSNWLIESTIIYFLRSTARFPHKAYQSNNKTLTLSVTREEEVSATVPPTFAVRETTFVAGVYRIWLFCRTIVIIRKLPASSVLESERDTAFFLLIGHFIWICGIVLFIAIRG